MKDVRDRLYRALKDRHSMIEQRRGWLDGSKLPVPVSTEGERATYESFERMSRGNFLGPVVDAYADRLWVDSILNEDGVHDKETWRALTAANARADIHAALETSLATGWGYILCLPHLRKSGQATTRPLAPESCITEAWSDDPAEVRYALVLTRDDANHLIVRLYDAADVHTWTGPQPLDNGVFTCEANSLKNLDYEGSRRHGLGVVPVAPLGNGDCVIERGLTHQQRANQSALHAVAIERLQSFRTLIVTNLELERDKDGEPKDPGIKLAPHRVNVLEPNEDTTATPSIWQSQTTTTAEFHSSVQAALTQLCGATGVPPHYVLPTAGASVSAEVLKASEQVFRARLRSMATRYTEQLAPMLAALRASVGLDPAPVRAHFDLGLPADIGPAGDAVGKLVANGMPLRQALVQSGLASPAEADAIADNAETRTLLADLAGLAQSAPGDQPPSGSSA